MTTTDGGFALSEQLQMVQDMARQFCERELLPQIPALEAGEIMPFPIMRKLVDTFGIAAMAEGAIRKRLARLRAGEDGGSGGLMGGTNEDLMMPFVLFKELSRISPGFAMSFGVSLGLAGGAVLKKGTAGQIERWGLPLATFAKIGSWCLTEPGAGSDAFGSMTTTARRGGDGWRIRGQKTFITNAPAADIFVVYCRAEGVAGAGESAPIATFVLDRDMPGLEVGKPMAKMGMKDSPTAEVYFDDVRAGDERLLGSLKVSTRASAKDSLGDERSGLPAMAWGIIERCYEIALAYARERRQFGRPIGEFQAVQLKLANMYTHLRNVENIVYRTAWMSRQGIHDTAFICASKAYCSKAAFEVANEAIQILGGYGYMQEYHVEKLLRDAKLLEIGAGTTDINLLTAARAELGLG